MTLICDYNPSHSFYFVERLSGGETLCKLQQVVKIIKTRKQNIKSERVKEKESGKSDARWLRAFSWCEQCDAMWEMNMFALLTAHWRWFERTPSPLQREILTDANRIALPPCSLSEVLHRTSDWSESFRTAVKHCSTRPAGTWARLARSRAPNCARLI